MKKLNLFLLSAFLLGVISCSSDDDSSSGDLTQIDPNPVEETALDATTVSENITINGLAKIDGDAPAPTGNISFTLPVAEQSAFLQTGFELNFDAPSNYRGAYIQIASEDGTIAPGYFDTGVQALRARNAKQKNTKNRLFGKQAKMDDRNIFIDFAFDEKVSPGKFCYFICIYDDAGNISDPIEVCVEVEAWGGNNNFAGTWNFVKEVEDGITIPIGEESCDDYEYTISCSNQESLTIDRDYCYIIESFAITFSEDGTYEYISKDSNVSIDNQATAEACSPVFGPRQEETYTSKGRWAYDEEEKRLTLVEFEYREVDGNGEVSENSSLEGELVFDGGITLTGSEFTLTESYNEDGINETYQYFFTR
ncbi:hypothetical protein J8281_12870 [Aquimarina sp. U1-2]|uniref:hypothetical protein n=1 Tax=Aquimarina sp. U1-2 TaxID=2823141 RepID=UPI001AED08E6|nr:hypothetical protein [Aquimarina sp. U1-2]MBP2833081.1 hypothetical protein [Aquimarina sp. U1-2]